MTAIATRAADISTIERLVDEAIAAEPARGAAGSRCEKALSNGTFRPKRNAETICDTGLCCGAARIPKGEAVMIIETCQTEGTTEYAYQPPRAAMETTAPATVNHPFLCIDGAQKLAAAASALAAAVYMLA